MPRAAEVMERAAAQLRYDVMWFGTLEVAQEECGFTRLWRTSRAALDTIEKALPLANAERRKGPGEAAQWGVALRLAYAVVGELDDGSARAREA